MFKKFLLTTVTLLFPLAASAQSLAPGEPDTSKVRVRIGPLYLNPTLALTNAGVDDNVFNEPDQAEPKKDFTMTVTPATEGWLRFGRTWFSGSVKEDLVYYRKYASERSTNNSYKGAWLVPLNRLILNAAVEYLSTRDRPGFEIDARSQRKELGYNGSVEIRALSKTFFGVRGERRKIDFDKDAVFLANNLQFELNRTVTSGALTTRHQVTPLTAITFDVIRQQDRFQFSPLRDADSTLIQGGLKFDPFALIKGRATFGYRDFEPLSAGLPNFKGTTAAVDLTYVALGTTKFGVQVSRDVQYSFDINQPYYLQTGFSGSIAQQIYGPLDIVGRAGAARLEYRNRAGASVGVVGRVDQVRSYGGGFGYRVGRDLRVGFNVDRQHRESPFDGRQYNGLRYGTSVTYGF